MRVLMVGNFYPPHHFGGYEQVWGSAAEHLRARGHDVRVLATTYRHPGTADGDEPDVHRVLRWYWRDRKFDIPGERIGLIERLKIERHNHREINRHLNEFRPDVVSFWSMGGMSHSLIETTRRRGIPIVAFVHDEWLDYARLTDQWTRVFSAPRRRFAAALVEAVTRVPTRVDYATAGRYVFVSDFIRQGALRLAHAPPDTAIAHSGIDPVFIADLPEHQWRWRLLYVGRLDPKKGVNDAVAALARLPAQATLTIAGSWDPRDERALADFISEVGVGDRVAMLGQLSHEQLAVVYREHDALLFPVQWEEPWGLVPLEAMASGCPVVATGRGGSGEYLEDGRNCLLAQVGDPGSLAECVRRLAESPELRARLRAGGAQTAPRHTEPVFNAAVEHHLIEVARVPVSSDVATTVATL